MTVPDEAVEAARSVLHPYVDDDHFDLTEVVRAALTAAAPFIAAQAWDQGDKAGYEERATEDTSDYTPATNPYRSGT